MEDFVLVVIIVSVSLVIMVMFVRKVCGGLSFLMNEIIISELVVRKFKGILVRRELEKWKWKILLKKKLLILVIIKISIWKLDILIIFNYLLVKVIVFLMYLKI